MILIVGSVVSVVLVQRAADFAIDGPGDVIRLPINGVGLSVGNGVAGLNALAIVV